MTETFLSGKAKIAGVIGWPISHSKSPKLHGFWLRRYGIDGAYVPLPVHPDKLEQAFAGLRAAGFAGFNATIPHKEKLIPLADRLDPLVKRVGAANTIVFHENGEAEAKNTDVFGFSENVRQGGFVFDPSCPVATVLGAGGAARAIIVALQDMGFAQINIVNRDQKKAMALVESLSYTGRFSVSSWDETKKALEGSALLVNTTSLGMTGQPPLDIDLAPLPETAFVTDAVYAPLETSLILQAKERGLATVDGLGMLLYQAQPAFEAWFGQKPVVVDDLRNFVLGAS